VWRRPLAGFRRQLLLRAVRLRQLRDEVVDHVPAMLDVVKTGARTAVRRRC
jgi:hypothetical protein